MDEFDDDVDDGEEPVNKYTQPDEILKDTLNLQMETQTIIEIPDQNDFYKKGKKFVKSLSKNNKKNNDSKDDIEQVKCLFMPYYKTQVKGVKEDLEKKMVKYHNLLKSQKAIPNKRNDTLMKKDSYYTKTFLNAENSLEEKKKELDYMSLKNAKKQEKATLDLLIKFTKETNTRVPKFAEFKTENKHLEHLEHQNISEDSMTLG
eukprot:CAMPEP_0205800598 /NCGR_PEP_ID=MMETSP0205-20121125/2287_1 /ASSEMBLY_ACC=CAM_ASM_000278 /TAXON_ID=36767 /ORGANISM="Euplotes focardii, Strain TN1" /LENGTH=203 /DNA_ID=CAMNT_0053063907 /DNA_START=87 /DNA_END=694 /DNA_ORIENTATION=+